ncbi:trypsin beta-like [Malaya genurostris]|uniref:trypsin beta-like n=1 Tax=Malaya genurostris TaxID=325434 RepID=UPI0026F39920|nr:trypsin beta-like [Malaya genurostris]
MHFFLVLLLFSVSVFAETKRLTVEEALAIVNQPPAALQNLIARKTNSIHDQIQNHWTRNSTRIVGGTEATIEEIPYQVALLYRTRQICGGSIISHSWVLTAAHCLSWYPSNSDITIRSGSSFHGSGGIVHRIYYYNIHELYDSHEFPHDVATIRVRVPFIGSSLAVIPLADSEWIEGTPVLVTGWGLDSNGYTPAKLQKVEIPVISRSDCSKQWENMVTADMICAGAKDINPCNGDSGGPAAQLGVQHGIVSWGSRLCTLGMPSVYTNIAHPSIRNFIKRTARV